MMPRAASTVADAKNPSSASSQRPRIGFSIDFLVGNGKNNNNPAASADSRSQDSADESGGKKNSDGKDSPPDRMVSSSPDGSSPSTSPPIGIPAGSSPLFQTWNPSAGSAPAGNFPPTSSYLEMATLANLRNLYGQPDASGRPAAAGFFGSQQPQHPHANNASAAAAAAAGLSPLFAMHGAGPGHIPVFGGAGGGVGAGGVGGRPADALAQQWWLLAQARQQQQRIFAAAAAASHRFAPGHSFTTISFAISIHFHSASAPIPHPSIDYGC